VKNITLGEASSEKGKFRNFLPNFSVF